MKTKKYVLYLEDGAIDGEISIPDGVAYSPPHNSLETSDEVSPLTHFVDIKTKELCSKHDLLTAHTVNKLAVYFDDLPKGLNVETNDMGTITDDQPLVIEYDLPGTYAIRFSGHVRYLDHELEVTVDDA